MKPFKCSQYHYFFSIQKSFRSYRGLTHVSPTWLGYQNNKGSPRKHDTYRFLLLRFFIRFFPQLYNSWVSQLQDYPIHIKNIVIFTIIYYIINIILILKLVINNNRYCAWFISSMHFCSLWKNPWKEGWPTAIDYNSCRIPNELVVHRLNSFCQILIF